MRLPFFRTQARKDILTSALADWAGTPFVGQSAIRGVGCDCVRFAAAVLHEVGAATEVEWPRYCLRGGGREMLDVLCNSIEATGCFDRIEPAGVFEPGDVLVFSTGRSLHHLGLVERDSWFWHCYDAYGVTRCSMEDSTFAKHLFRIYRPMEEVE